MRKKVQDYEDMREFSLTAITPEIEVMISKTPPTIIGMPFDDLFLQLANRSIDIAFCGMKFDLLKMSRFDTTYPPYAMTGYQALDNAIGDSPAILQLVSSIFAMVDNEAVLIVYLILICSIVFGFIIQLAENTFAPYTSQFRRDFAEGSQDGVWFSFIVMTTVGFGDLAPKTAIGRLLCVFWIFGSMTLTALLYADIVGNFAGISVLNPAAGASVSGPDDLAGLLVGVTDPRVARELAERVPGVRTAAFGRLGQADLFSALLNNSLDMAVERAEIIQYTNAQDPDIQGLLQPAGRVFYREGVVFGVRRHADGSPHAVHALLSVALAEATRLDGAAEDARWGRWFGDASSIDGAGAGRLEQQLQDAAVDAANAFMVRVVAVCAGLWAAKTAASLALRAPAFLARYEACAAARAVLGVAPPWDRVVRDAGGRAAGRRSEAEVLDEMCVALGRCARMRSAGSHVPGHHMM
jgi:hypothetical protein